jgi:membrane protease YdiL (CAAX protease family)
VWFLIILGFVVFSDGLSILIGKPIVPEFMSKTYASLNSPWILWMALLVAAPLSEELFFRGFLIKGLSASLLRWYGAVILSSAAWAIVHQQYDLYGMVTIFSLGLILGVARVKTGSIILTMFLHSFCTLIAIAETLIHLRRMSA